MTVPALDVLRRALDAARPEDYADETDAALADLDALVQAAQADVDEYLEWRSIAGNEHKATPVMDALVAALARVTGEAR